MKSIRLSFWTKIFVTLLSKSSCCPLAPLSFISLSASIEITASEDSRSWSVRFRLYVLILFNAENDLSTNAVVAGIVSTSWSQMGQKKTKCTNFWIFPHIYHPISKGHAQTKGEGNSLAFRKVWNASKCHQKRYLEKSPDFYYPGFGAKKTTPGAKKTSPKNYAYSFIEMTNKNGNDKWCF